MLGHFGFQLGVHRGCRAGWPPRDRRVPSSSGSRPGAVTSASTNRRRCLRCCGARSRSAVGESSTAITVADGQCWASATASAPVPVHRSTIIGLWRSALSLKGSDCPFQQRLGLRARDEHTGADLQQSAGRTARCRSGAAAESAGRAQRPARGSVVEEPARRVEQRQPAASTPATWAASSSASTRGGVDSGLGQRCGRGRRWRARRRRSCLLQPGLLVGGGQRVEQWRRGHRRAPDRGCAP